MKKRNLLVAALPIAAFLLPLVSAQGSESEDARGPGLVRVQPGPVTTEPEDAGDRDSLDAERWRERLSAPDHKERLEAFERLVRRGWRDERVSALLREIVDDPDAGSELRWTARLALRELERVQRIGRPLAFFATPGDPLGDGSSPLDLFFGGTPSVPPTPAFPFTAPRAGEGSRSTRMNVEQTEEGWKIRITESVDGEETVREYEGESLDAILEANPELADELDVMPFDLGGGMRLELHGTPGRDLGQLFERGLGEFRGFRPLHPFEWTGPDGEKRRMHFLVEPQRESQPVRTDVLGVRVGQVSDQQARELGLDPGEGLYVASVLPGTIAHVLGMGAGDVMLQLNGASLHDARDVTDALRSRAPRDGVEVVWIDTLGRRHEETWRPESTPAQGADELEDF